VACIVLFAVSAWAHSSDVNNAAKNCECIGDDCGCCEHIDWSHMGVNGTICTNVTYLRQDYGISVTVTYNAYTIFNETMSAKNPPPFCIGIPELEKIHAAACVRLYDLSFTKERFHGCAKASISIYHMIHKSVNLGCWNIPRGELATAFMNQSSRILEMIKNELEELAYLKNEVLVVNMI